jgi:DNA polymerase-3 subunit alpha
MAGLLTSETGNTTKVVKYINECRDMQIKVLPPDVNSSDWNFTPDGDAIRFGLGAVKNLGQAAVEAIITARKEVGKFKSIFQFCEKVDMTSLNKRMIESAIKAGAMDSIEGTRSQLMAVTDRAIEHGQRLMKDRLSGQTGLFGDLFVAEEEADEPLPRVPDWTPQEKLMGEKELLGFYVTGHPLDEYKDKVSELATHFTDNMEDLKKGDEVALCGTLSGIQRRRNKDQKPWASMQLEDLNGSIEAMAFTTVYESVLPFLVEDKPMLVRGLVLPEENTQPKLSIQSIVPLEVARVPLPSLISIRVTLKDSNNDKAAEISRLFARKQGSSGVRLRLEKRGDFSVILDVASKIRPDKEFRAEIERICGPECVEVLAE